MIKFVLFCRQNKDAVKSQMLFTDGSASEKQKGHTFLSVMKKIVV